MKKLSLLLFSPLLLLACNNKTVNAAFVDGRIMELPYPPNMKPIGDNFFADETEISNIDWMEFEYWTYKIYGADSEEHRAVLPDTMVWVKDTSMYMYNEPFINTYYRHPAYSDYPVVGISKEQAEKFCEWRTNRVAEMMLVRAGMMEYDVEKSKDFSWRMIETEPLKSKMKACYMKIPVFRLPSEKEWELFASGGLNKEVYPKGLKPEDVPKKYLKKKYFCFNLYREHPQGRSYASITAPTRSYAPNGLGLYNCIGNVAEMTSDDGVAKGGSWMHQPDESNVSSTFSYEGATQWLGFRCVAEYK